MRLAYLDERGGYSERSQNNDPIFTKFLHPRQIFEKKKTGRKRVKKFAQSLRFFGERSPSQLDYISAKGSFWEILGSVGQKLMSQNKTNFSSNSNE